MKNIVRMAKKWLRYSPGFTLVELMVAMAVGSFVMGGVFTVWTQLFNVTATNSNYMAAFRQVQNSGDWISRDALMTQQVYDMASATLVGDISDIADEITVDSAGDFPPVGVIAIGDELIRYTGVDYGNNKFTGCIRGNNAVAHSDGTSVTLFVGLGWTAWSGAQHQVVYNLKANSSQLVRSYYIDVSLQTTTLVAEAIVAGETTSSWDYDEKELTAVITAQFGEEKAVRTYKVHPRPLF
jgi:prepilin-type N-terminal cleavage/methylation domain-containing protein